MNPAAMQTSTQEIDKAGLVLRAADTPLLLMQTLSAACSAVAHVQIYARLSDRFASHATRSLEYRLYNLKQLAYMVKDNEGAFHEALKRDLDKGPMAVNLEELYTMYNEIDLAVNRLAEWMKDEGRWWDAMLSFKFMNPKIVKQPKGVALIIGPWNYPFQCCLNPLIGAIAAGCTAVVKPSELAPASAALLARLIPRYLDSEAYAVVLGGVEETTALLEKQWGHILFTGSSRVGKIVAGAAAKTLTPTTLELGGKNPVIVTECANIDITAMRMLSMKSIGSGQICVAPDYVLCVKSRVDELTAALLKRLEKHYPASPHPDSYMHAQTYACLRSAPDFSRQVAFLDKAQEEGKVLHRGEVDEATRRMGVSVVRLNAGGKGETGGLVEQEVFGPVLTIIPVEDVDEAVRYINARPKPLALYVCATRRGVFDKIVQRTSSGSAMLNDFVFTAIARSQPFGGVGESGWGSYHGYDGFKAFSHFRSTLQVPLFLEPLMTIRYPPPNKIKQFLMPLLFTSGVQFARPTSVEGERRKLVRAKYIRAAAVALVVALGAFLGFTRLGWGDGRWGGWGFR